MQHVKQIEEIIDKGKTLEAHSALDELLSLGPSNTAALKLRAQLFAFEGRFSDENRIWEQIAAIDYEDADAIDYLLRRQVEDRDLFYFTDDIPGGGRRYLTRSSKLTQSILITVMSCMIFLLLYRQVETLPAFLADTRLMLINFCLFVLSPAFLSLFVFARSLKAVTVDREGVTLATPLRKHTLVWDDIEKVVLARQIRGDHSYLSLVVIPKDRTATALKLDLNITTTALRARTHLVRDIARLHAEPDYAKVEDLGLDRFSVVAY